MKKILFLNLFAMLSLIATAQVNKDEQPYQTTSLSNASIRNVLVQTSGGSISVTGVNASEARLEMYVSPNNSRTNTLSSEEIKKRLNEDYNLTIDIKNNKVTAIAKAKERDMDWRYALNISFKVFVPQNVSTDLATSGGSIKLEGITGTQDFATSGGSLHINNVGGKIIGRTSGGSIHLSRSRDEINVATSGGSIDAKDCTGRMKLTTSGGSLRLNDLNGYVNATTSGGSVLAENITGELFAHTSGGNVVMRDLSCTLETSTSGGNINIAIKELGKYIRIENSAGNVNLQLPDNKGIDLNLHAYRIKTGTLSNFNGSSDDDSVRGKLNGGGVPVTVNAGSGRITLEFK